MIDFIIAAPAVTRFFTGACRISFSLLIAREAPLRLPL